MGHLRIVRPVLPDRLDWLTLSAFRIGQLIIDLRFERRDDKISVDADVHEGSIDIAVIEDVSRW